MKTWQKIAAAIAGVATTAGALGAVFWGVPYYIDRQVDAKVAEELAGAGVSTTKEAANQNKATIGAVLNRLDSMETRMIERDRLFMQYLQEQANGGN